MAIFEASYGQPCGTASTTSCTWESCEWKFVGGFKYMLCNMHLFVIHVAKKNIYSGVSKTDGGMKYMLCNMHLIVIHVARKNIYSGVSKTDGGMKRLQICLFNSTYSKFKFYI